MYAPMPARRASRTSRTRRGRMRRRGFTAVTRSGDVSAGGDEDPPPFEGSTASWRPPHNGAVRDQEARVAGGDDALIAAGGGAGERVGIRACGAAADEAVVPRGGNNVVVAGRAKDQVVRRGDGEQRTSA